MSKLYTKYFLIVVLLLLLFYIFMSMSIKEGLKKAKKAKKIKTVKAKKRAKREAKKKRNAAAAAGAGAANPPPEPTTGNAGAPYSYINFIKTPKELGISDKGTIKTLTNDINGLIAYAKLLVEGNSKASKAINNGPLGNKFFVKSPGNCNAVGLTGGVQDRYLYINNIPLGHMPGSNIYNKSFRGLIPGMTTDLEMLDPVRIADSFLSTGKPDCMPITMEIIDNAGGSTNGTHYVSLTDISYIDPCLFPKNAAGKRINPQTNVVCPIIEGFTQDEEEEEKSLSRFDLITDNISTDYIAQLFIFSASLYSVFLLYKVLKNSKR